MSIMTLKDYIAEARKEDKTYKEEKTKGLVDKVILELEGSDAATATKLAKRFNRLKKSISRLQDAEKELEPKLRGLVDNAFDEAKDIFVTRTLATTQFTITIAKKQAAKDRSEVSYDKVLDGLAALLDDDLQVKLKELIEANTRRWVADPPKAGMSVKPIEEGVVDAAKGALGAMITKLEAFTAKLKARFTAWGKQYDAKLDNLKDMAKKAEAEPVTQVAEAAPGKFATFAAGKMTPELIDTLNSKAQGADEVTHQGKKYKRSGPKNAVSQPGKWKLCESASRKGTLKYSVAKVKACSKQIDSDNIKAFDQLVKGGGTFQTLDARPYMDLLDDLKIVYQLTESAMTLTAAEKAEIIEDFKEWSGGYTPDECPCKPDGRKDDKELTHESYIKNALDTKFEAKKDAVEAFLCDYKP